MPLIILLRPTTAPAEPPTSLGDIEISDGSATDIEVSEALGVEIEVDVAPLTYITVDEG